MTVSAKRLKELERSEAKLNALEAGGVDNWDAYADSLKDYWAENEREEKMDDLVTELSEAFGECAYEPSERGAGIAFNESVEQDVLQMLHKAGVYFKDED